METPDQYKKRTGHQIPNGALVWCLSPQLPRWDSFEYSTAIGFKDVVMIIADCNGKPDVDYDSRIVLEKKEELCQE